MSGPSFFKFCMDVEQKNWLQRRGIVAVYKPKGPTSHDVIDLVRDLTGEQRVGHAGTLDPLASGVLVVGIGREATRTLAVEVAKEKEYVAEVCLGMYSETDDEEGSKTEVIFDHQPSEADVRQALTTFVGRIEQVPPAYSAIKVGGKKSYKAARAGKMIELAARPVEIKEIELLSYAWPVVHLRVVTGPGVYIRALARDLGQALGTGGYLQALERTRVGSWTMEQAERLPTT
jgi:tRNA pseudouridine55 synthase